MEHHSYKINKDIPVPLYYQLKQVILNDIKQNVLKVGSSIPTEAEFCNMLNITRPTVRQALSELVNEGYLYRLKGKGTFVSKPKIDARFFQKLDSFNNEMTQKGLKPSTQVIDFKVIPGIKKINSIFDMPEEEELIYLYRLRFADEEPIVFLETYLPYSQYHEMMDEDFSSTSLYSAIEEKYDRKIARATRKIESVNASKENAQLLNIKKNDAIFFVKTTAYDQNDIVVEYSEARYRGDRNQFSIDLARW